MKSSAVTWLSWRWLLGLGPRQTTYLGSISGRNVNDGLSSAGPVVAPELFTDTSDLTTSIRTMDGQTISSVRYPKKQLIFPFTAAEKSPTRHSTGRLSNRRAYE